MSLFDDFSKKITDAGQTTIQKTKNIADIAKFNSMISDEEKKIRNIYEQIGKQYVYEFGQSPEEPFEDYVSSINECKSKIAGYQNKIKILKGVSECPNCGAEVETGVLFCSSCGTEMPKPSVVMQEGIYCPECGAVVPVDSKFCTSCGKPLSIDSGA